MKKEEKIKAINNGKLITKNKKGKLFFWPTSGEWNFSHFNGPYRSTTELKETDEEIISLGKEKLKELNKIQDPIIKEDFWKNLEEDEPEFPKIEYRIEPYWANFWPFNRK